MRAARQAGSAAPTSVIATPEHERPEETAQRQRQADHEDGASRGQQPDEERSEPDAGDDSDGGSRSAEDQRLAHHDPEHLARRGADGAEQAQLALTLPDRHRQRVAHEERGHHDGDQAEQDRHADDLAARRVEPRGGFLGGLDHVRLVEPGGHRLHGCRARVFAEIEVDVSHGRGNFEGGVEGLTAGHDHVPAAERSEAGVRHEPDDPQRVEARSLAREQQLVTQLETMRVGPARRHQRAVWLVSREVLPRDEARLTDGRLVNGIDADDEDGDHGLVGARQARHGDEPLADRGCRDDGGVGTQLLERSRAESRIGEGPKADIGGSEKVGGRGSHGSLGRGADDQRGRHDGHAERDPDDGQRRAQWAGGQPSCGERRQAHRCVARGPARPDVG